MQEQDIDRAAVGNCERGGIGRAQGKSKRHRRGGELEKAEKEMANKKGMKRGRDRRECETGGSKKIKMLKQEGVRRTANQRKCVMFLLGIEYEDWAQVINMHIYHTILQFKQLISFKRC